MNPSKGDVIPCPENFDSTTAALAVLAIGEVALMESSVAILLKDRWVDAIKRQVRASVYWPEFCRLAALGRVPEDFAGRGILGRCILGWAKQDAGAEAGMTWWNELSHDERVHALETATAVLRREASVGDAWELWRAGKISVQRAPASKRWYTHEERQAWVGKRVICYSGPHYGRVHQVVGVSETLAHLYHSTSGDRYSAPFCDLEVL